MYILAFKKDKSFFYENDVATIYAFMTEHYWGDGLMFNLILLVNLLDCDSGVQPTALKKDLIKKSKELNEYLNQYLKSQRSI